MLLSLGIGEDLRSSKFIVNAPEDANSPRFQDLQDAMVGSVTPGNLIAIDTANVLRRSAVTTPFAWLIPILVKYFLIRKMSDTRLSTAGTVNKPDVTMKPSTVPLKSHELEKFLAWLVIMEKFCNAHCPQARIIF